MDTLPTRSLTSSTRKSPELSPTRRSSPSRKEYKQQERANELGQIMLNYLDVEGLIQLYKETPEVFDAQDSLNTLTIRFGLSKVSSFKQFLRLYDTIYATVRSYNYNNRTAYKIFLLAAKEGNTRAVLKGIQDHRNLRDPYAYLRGMEKAAAGGQIAIMSLLSDSITAYTEEYSEESKEDEKYRAIVIGAAKGGQLDLLKLYLASDKLNFGLMSNIACAAARHGQLETVKYLFTDTRYPLIRYINAIRIAAGRSGNKAVIDYLISKG